MKRRTFLTGSGSVLGITALSGCSGLFGGDETDNNNNDDDDNGGSGDSIEPPHSGLNQESITSTFLDAHFSELQSSDNFTVIHQRKISDNSVQTTEWYRSYGTGYQRVTSEGDLKEERYYGEDVMGVKNTSTDIINLVERSIPSINKWANGDFIQNIISDASVEISDETDTHVSYTGVINLNRFESPQGFTLEILKEKPIITSITFADMSESYTLKDLGETTVDEPNWYLEALEENVIVTGGGYPNANALILEFSEQQNRTVEGMYLSVVSPSGSTQSVQVEETINPGDQIYLVSRQGNLYYSIGHLPPVQDKDKLEEGVHTILGSTLRGDHLFEIRVDYSN